MFNRRTPKIKQLIISAMLVALSIVLGKLLQIPIGNSIRISFENLPIIMGGIVFGPVQGLLIGVVSDLVGCLLVGYTINPIITVAAGLMGLIPGLLALLIKKRSYIMLSVIELITHTTCSVILKSIGLWLMYSTPFEVLILRLPIYIAISFAEASIIYALYRMKVISN